MLVLHEVEENPFFLYSVAVAKKHFVKIMIFERYINIFQNVFQSKSYERSSY